MSLSSFRQGTKIEVPRKCQKVALLKQTQTNFTGKVKVMKPLGGTKEIEVQHKLTHTPIYYSYYTVELLDFFYLHKKNKYICSIPSSILYSTSFIILIINVL